MADKKLVARAGLRTADTDTLLVLTSDILRTPLVRLEPNTLCDLLALSELDKGLPVALSRDLAGFSDQMQRELQDLPDGNSLVEFAASLEEVPAENVPAVLREALTDLVPNLKSDAAIEALNELLGEWEGTEPEPLEPPEIKAAPKKTVVAPKEAPAKKSSGGKATPASQVDTRRAEWIQNDVVDRLQNYKHDGLKESIIVAGARHRAPWDDVTEKEVMAVLRRLDREKVLKKSAGRWKVLR